jgi:nitrate reductase NapE
VAQCLDWAGARTPPGGRVEQGTPVHYPDKSFTKAQEFRSFLFLAVVMAPVIAGVVVAGYGFLVWIYQIFAGPPTGH